MSTKMSTDMIMSRSSTRVHAPPGGTSSITFGDPSSTTPPPMTKAAAAAALTSGTAGTAPLPPQPSAPATAETMADSLATLSISTSNENQASRIGVVVAGHLGVDAVVDAIVRALALEGIKGDTVVVSHISDPLILPYAALHMGQSGCAVVIASAVISGDAAHADVLAHTLVGSLLQSGTSNMTQIVPGIICQSSLLEVKALLPHKAAAWAKSAATLLSLKSGSSLPIMTYAEPIIAPPTPLSPEVTSLDVLLDDLRESVKSHGARGIFGLGRAFRIADDDNNGSIDLAEFTKAISEHALLWTPQQIKLVFDSFDADKSGTISFDEFLKGLRGGLNERRRQLVLMAFEVLDANHRGVVEFSDIQAKYSADKHPDVISGKRSAADVLREFMDTFDGNHDGKVTPAEFCEYYSNVSASIDDDDYFELMIRNAWHISGGEGWCANTTCRRVLVTHADGRQTVAEIKNDLSIDKTDTAAMMANLAAQGITDVVGIDLVGSTGATPATSAVDPKALPATATQNSVPLAAGSRPAPVTSTFDTVRPSTAPAAAPLPTRRGFGAGASSIVFG